MCGVCGNTRAVSATDVLVLGGRLLRIAFAAVNYEEGDILSSISGDHGALGLNYNSFTEHYGYVNYLIDAVSSCNMLSRT